MKEKMIINNFRMIDSNANPQNSNYCYEDTTITSVATKIHGDVYKKKNILISEASIFFQFENRWISAVYTKSINPSIQNDYDSFMSDLTQLVSNYTKK